MQAMNASGVTIIVTLISSKRNGLLHFLADCQGVSGKLDNLFY